ncbi:MAG: metal-sulfur cluster assembly factor, partial [bacterium]
MDEPTQDQAASEPGATPSATATANGKGLTREQVLDALRNVYDPELGINIVDLGLVYSVE